MGYVIIELPVETKDGYSFVPFNKKKFMEEKGITLLGDPIKPKANPAN